MRLTTASDPLIARLRAATSRRGLGRPSFEQVDGRILKKLPVMPRTNMSSPVPALLAEPSLVCVLGKTARRGRLAERQRQALAKCR